MGLKVGVFIETFGRNPTSIFLFGFELFLSALGFRLAFNRSVSSCIGCVRKPGPAQWGAGNESKVTRIGTFRTQVFTL